ncbi:MAG: M14 family zinc carboxypeptidase [Candidatus Zixiibacteriota bacterium]
MRKWLKPILTGALLLACVCPQASAQSTEYYFQFEIKSWDELIKLSHVISVDNVDNNTVHAYASEREMAQFQSLGYSYTLLPSPGSLIEPRMASSPREMRAWDFYPTYEAYVQMMYGYETLYPGLCQVYNIGTTVQGRELLIAKISANVAVEEDEPEVLYSSTMHGDETTGYVLTLRMIDFLLSGYGVINELTNMVDSMEIWINPLANPDGTYITGNSSVSGAQRYNAAGYDLNRNFPDPDEGDYPNGPRQPETSAMVALAQANNFIISANFHGGAEVVNYPWDTWPQRHADDDWFIDICRQYADTAQKYSSFGYMNDLNNGITNGWDWYPIVGGRQDMMTFWYGCRETTIELSNTKLLSASQLPAHWNYNRDALLDYLKQALLGVRGIVTDASSSAPVAATINVIGHDADSSEVYTDPVMGDYHRMIAAGTHDLLFTALGYLPHTENGVVVSSGGTTRLDVQMQPIPSIPVMAFSSHDASGVNPGDAVSMNVTLVNDGGADATNLSGTLLTSDPLITITQASAQFPTIAMLGGSGTSLAPYQYSVSPTTSLGHQIDFSLTLAADGGYVDTVTFTVMVGQNIEDFESGGFTSYPWSMSGNQAWVIDASIVFEGAYSAGSGNINDNQSSQMEVTLNSLQAGTVSFYYKVSSESSYDFLRFYVDGVQKSSWSGNVDWTEYNYPVSAGSHTFRWRYTKDGSVSSGSDRGWVDYVTFPQVNADSDGDGINDAVDNCPSTFNPLQEDTDSDGIGDSCDNCVLTLNPGQTDTDSDGIGDSCDNCVSVANATQDDADADGIGDLCDNCPAVSNTLQEDFDLDNVGDSCDNCPLVSNPGQEDANSNGVGDACDWICGDVDGSGGSPDIVDLTYLADFLFDGGPPPPKSEAADLDGSGGSPDIVDLTIMVDYLFGGTVPPTCGL